MLKYYVSKIADNIAKGRFDNPYYLLFLLDMTCEYFYEYHRDCYDILYPALRALEKSLGLDLDLDLEKKERGE